MPRYIVKMKREVEYEVEIESPDAEIAERDCKTFLKGEIENQTDITLITKDTIWWEEIQEI